MKLKEYLEQYGIRTGWFAEKIPCTSTYLCCIMRESNVPSVLIQNRISELTGGKVTSKDFAVKKRKSDSLPSKLKSE